MMDEIGVPVRFRVSREELALLLGLMDGVQLAGFDEDVFVGLPETGAEAVRTAVYRSLLARGYVVVLPDGGYVVDESLRKILSFCVYPQHLLLLQSRFAGATAVQQETFYFYEAMTVQHYLPFAGVHDFSLLLQPPDFAGLIMDRLAQVTSGAGKRPYHIQVPQATLEAVSDMVVQQDRTQAVTLLQTHTVDDEAAHLLVETLSNPSLRLWLHLISAAAEPATRPMEQSLTFLCSPDVCWLVQTDAAVEGLVTLELTALPDVAPRLEILLHPVMVGREE
jgi:hypothetical protein